MTHLANNIKHSTTLLAKVGGTLANHVAKVGGTLANHVAKVGGTLANHVAATSKGPGRS